MKLPLGLSFALILRSKSLEETTSSLICSFPANFAKYKRRVNAICVVSACLQSLRESKKKREKKKREIGDKHEILE